MATTNWIVETTNWTVLAIRWSVKYFFASNSSIFQKNVDEGKRIVRQLQSVMLYKQTQKYDKWKSYKTQKDKWHDLISFSKETSIAFWLFEL